jgi:hypothetical protein
VSLSKRLDTLEKQFPPPEDHRFNVWQPEDRETWASVSAREKDALWTLFQRCGPIPNTGTAQAMVRRWEDGRWHLTQLNTQWRRAEHCIVSTWTDVGDDAFIAWAGRECTPEEIEVLARMAHSGWNPEALQEGDTALLHGLIDRLPRR